MFNVPWFSISANLKDKRESIPEIATRFVKLLDSLGQIDPLMSKWFSMMEGDSPTPLKPDVRMIETSLHYWANRKTEDGSEPFYTFGATTNGYENVWRPDDLNIFLRAGTEQYNKIWFHTALEVAPNPHLVSFSLFKKILFATADAFDPKYSNAHPGALDRNFMMSKRNKLPIFAGWMVLLPRELASQITPPPQAIQQTREDGSLFMAATDETFDVNNPEHLTVSKAMQDAIEPINKW
ncbi:MAG: Imm52 family immunity protein [Beijerinckiaceae bacterium]|jgi:hypothetical protein